MSLLDVHVSVRPRTVGRPEVRVADLRAGEALVAAEAGRDDEDLLRRRLVQGLPLGRLLGAVEDSLVMLAIMAIAAGAVSLVRTKGASAP